MSVLGRPSAFWHALISCHGNDPAQKGAMTMIFKIMPEGDWSDAVAAGVYNGSPVDKADGFIHFSGADTVVETAARYYAGKAGQMLIAFDDAALGVALKWEASRGGLLFPHLYAALDPALALWAKPLPLRPDGGHVFPDLDA
jgi:uncharacterized protein (DUF952 family)